MDPVTRIEGHMKVEIKIDTVDGQSQIIDAHCTGTLFRGFENLLKGRASKDATVITQRICGVCPISHGQASVLALEDVSGWQAAGDGRRLRNLALGANFVMSHILHFYLLAALDYVAAPVDASPWTPAWAVDMRGGLEDISAHIGGAVEARRRAHELGAIFGGRMPTSHTYLPGGFSGAPDSQKINQAKSQIDWLLNYIQNVYIPDVELLAGVYDDYFQVGAGCENLMAYGVFELDDSYEKRLLNPGYKDKNGQVTASFPEYEITESVTHSWYSGNGLQHPSAGVTAPQYPKSGAYSWLKAPRLKDQPFEAGPLARMTVNGDYSRGVSVMDRHKARAYEALKIAQAMRTWIGELNGGPVYDTGYRQQSGAGVGLTEAPRGALGHWVEVNNDQIVNYQVITPTCWNASPRDNKSVPGPMEKALIGTSVANPDQPVEALRVIHSFDPCLSCAVHMIRPDREPVVLYMGAGC
jgi:hydrogenase large subunit